MINTITLKNIKKYNNTKLELNKGLNVISGVSNQGKSSIILGLNWLFFNKPSGANYTSFNAQSKGSSVEVVFDNGLKIKRLLTKSKNEYHINGEIYKSFRFDIPEEMKELLYLTPSNLQLQAEPYFMLQNTSSEVGKMFNELKGIDEIEDVLTKASKNVNDLSNERKGLELQIEEDTANLQKLEGFEELQEKIIELEEKQNLYNQKEKLINDIEKELTNINKYSNLQNYYSNLIEYLKRPIEILLSKIDKLVKIQKKYNDIKKEYNNILKYQNEMENCKKYNNLKEPVTHCLEKINSVSLYQSEIDKMKSAKQQVIKNSQQATQVQETLSELKKKKKEIETELEICPVCNKPF